MKAVHFSLIAGTMLLAACAGGGARYTPILDGAPSTTYQADLVACQSLARNQTHLGQETMAAAVLGAGAGALLGSFDTDGDAAGGAIAGALAGGTASAVDVAERRKSIVIECLKGRGHPVVG